MEPTAAGLLMFGEEYKIIREFPEYFLDYRENLDPSIRWTDRLYSSSGDWTGNLFDFYFRVYNKLITDIKTPFQLEGGNRIDDTPIHKALREALANCIINADFYIGQGLIIKKNSDSIILENPGYIRIGKDQMLKGGISDPRNKALMKLFNLIGIGERAGSGIPNILSVWKQAGWKEPEVEEQYGPDRTILYLSLIKKSAIKSSDKKSAIKSSSKQTSSKKTQLKLDLILSSMDPGKEYTTKEISEVIGLKDARTRELLNQLSTDGHIIAVGKNKSRRYIKSIFQ